MKNKAEIRYKPYKSSKPDQVRRHYQNIRYKLQPNYEYLPDKRDCCRLRPSRYKNIIRHKVDKLF